MRSTLTPHLSRDVFSTARVLAIQRNEVPGTTDPSSALDCPLCKTCPLELNAVTMTVTGSEDGFTGVQIPLQIPFPTCTRLRSESRFENVTWTADDLGLPGPIRSPQLSTICNSSVCP